MDETKYHDILLKEYAEATSLCRNIEQLTRTSLSLFIPVATALVGLVAAKELGASIKFALSLAGLIYALLLLNTVYRQRAYYFKYVERAKQIETLIKRDGEPVMSLYASGATVAGSTRTYSNKLAIAGAFWLAAVYFAGAAFIYGCAVFKGPAL
jgi:hypothetical protein